jgi:hypothetical protein
MGPGAGVAAALAARGGVAPREVAIAELQAGLDQQGVVVRRATAMAEADAVPVPMR